MIRQHQAAHFDPNVASSIDGVAPGNANLKHTYADHPLAATFPMMNEEDFLGLCQHIKEQGLIEPIVLYDNQILDGRNRYKACLKMGVEPRFVTWEEANETMEPVQWVIGKNAQRRHLSSEQKACAATMLTPYLKELAKERQQHHGGTAPGRCREILPEKFQGVFHSEAAAEAAHLMKTNARYVYDAMKIKEEDPEAFALMQRGELTFKGAKARRQDRQEHCRMQKDLSSRVPDRGMAKLFRQIGNVIRTDDPDQFGTLLKITAFIVSRLDGCTIGPAEMSQLFAQQSVINQAAAFFDSICIKMAEYSLIPDQDLERDEQSIVSNDIDISTGISEIRKHNERPAFKAWLTETGQLRSQGVTDDLAGEIVRLTTGNLPLQKTLLLRHCERFDKHHMPHYLKEWEERAAIMEIDSGLSREEAELAAARICYLEAFLDDIKMARTACEKGQSYV